MLGVAWGEALSDNQAEKISAEDTQDAADHRPNQPLEAYGPQAYLEDQNAKADSRSDGG